MCQSLCVTVRSANVNCYLIGKKLSKIIELDGMLPNVIVLNGMRDLQYERCPKLVRFRFGSMSTPT